MKAKKRGMNRSPIYNRIEVKKLFPSNRYEMRDFWAVCPYTTKELYSKSRKRELVIWRDVGIVWAWVSGVGLREAAEMFGRTHCTTIHAIKEIRKAFEEGYGHTEMIEIVNKIRANSHEFILQTGDICQDELRSLVTLENLIGERL
jgi:hypothetical protein